MKPARIIVVAMMLPLLYTSASAQSKFNKYALEHPFSDPGDSRTAYKKRKHDDRFEGLHTEHYAGAVLDLVSYTQGGIDYELRKGEELHITSPLKKHKLIGVSGTNYGMGVYYRVDMEMNPATRRTLPVDEVLRVVNIGPQKLGLYGYLGDNEHPAIYLPLQVTSDVLKQTPDNKLQLILAANRNMQAVNWTYTPVKTGKVSKTYTVAGKPVHYKGDAIVLTLPAELAAMHGEEVMINAEGETAPKSTPALLDFKIMIP